MSKSSLPTPSRLLLQAVLMMAPAPLMAAAPPSAPETVKPPRYVQHTVQQEGVVNAPAAALWDVMTDWGGVMKWWVAVPGKPKAPMLSCSLIDGERERQVPRTRRCLFDAAKMKGLIPPPEVHDPNFVIPSSIDETLVHVDDAARYLVYVYSANFHPGSTTMQVVEEGKCRARFIIRYTSLEPVVSPVAVPAPASDAGIADAFGPDADYRGVKYYLEKRWRGRAGCP